MSDLLTQITESMQRFNEAETDYKKRPRKDRAARRGAKRVRNRERRHLLALIGKAREERISQSDIRQAIANAVVK